MFRKPKNEPVIEPLLLAATQVATYDGDAFLTNASGFLFERDNRLFLVTSRHVVADEATQHHPNRIEMELHTNPADMAQSTGYSIPLYKNGTSVWRQGEDAGGNIDVAVIELDRRAFPKSAVYYAFTPKHLPAAEDVVEIGSSLLVVGFPLGFHDTLHHVPVIRHAVVASSFGMRFQGHGYFLTDARTHRGSSGAPVVMRVEGPGKRFGDLPWMLVGVHSARFDVGSRDLNQDEALGLNCAWYVDILMTLTTK